MIKNLVVTNRLTMNMALKRMAMYRVVKTWMLINHATPGLSQSILFYPPLYPVSVPAMTIPLLSAGSPLLTAASLNESLITVPLHTASPPLTTYDVPNLDFL